MFILLKFSLLFSLLGLFLNIPIGAGEVDFRMGRGYDVMTIMFCLYILLWDVTFLLDGFS